MAKNNDLSFEFSVQFEDYSKVEKKLQAMNQQLVNSPNSKIGLKFDEKTILNSIQDISKRISSEISKNKQNEWINVEKFQSDVGQIVTVIKNISNPNQQPQIKISVDDKQIKKAEEQARNLQQQLQKTQEATEIKATSNPSQFYDQVGATGTKSYQAMVRHADKIQSKVDSLAKLSYNVNPISGEVNRAVLTYVDSMGKAVTETMGWQSVVDEAGNVIEKNFTTINKQVSDSVMTLDKLKTTAKEMKSTLTSRNGDLVKNNLIDQSVRSDLQKRINAVDIKNPQEAIRQYQALGKEINALAKNEKDIIRVQTALDKLVNTRAKLESGGFTTQEDLNKLSEMETRLTNLMSQLKGGEQLGSNKVSLAIKEMNRELTTVNTTVKDTAKNMGQIKKVQDALSSFQRTRQALEGTKGDFIKSNDIAELDKMQNSLATLLSLLEKGGKISDKDLSAQLSSINRGLITTRNNIRDNEKATVTWGNSLRNMATRLGFFTLGYQALSMLRRELREGIEDVVKLDEAMTTLSITMNNFGEASKGIMTKNVQGIATALSATTNQVLEATTTFANAGETTQSILDKVSSTIVLSNLTGLDVQTAVDTIQSATKQFDALADGSAQSAEKVTDSMVAISKALGLDFGRGIREMSESLNILGSLANETGMDIDETLGVISAGMEKLRLSGSEYATSMKTVMSRIYRTKDGDNNSAELLKTEKALNSIGIQVYNQQGGIRKFTDIMQELNAQWGTLTDKQRMYVSDALGGARQVSQVLATVSNMDRINELTNIGQNSDGAGMEAQAIWAESLRAKMQELTNASQIFWQTFISSEGVGNSLELLTSLVNGLTKLTETFGSLGTGVGVLTTAFLTFTNNPLRSLATDIVKADKGTMSCSKAMNILTTSIRGNTVATTGNASATATATASTGLFKTMLTALGQSAVVTTIKVVALQAVMSMGLSLAITAVVGGISKLISALSGSNEALQEFNAEITENVKTTGKMVQDAETLYTEIQKLQGALANTTSLEERTRLEKELAEAQRQMAEIMPETASGFDNNNNLMATSNTLIEQQIKLKKIAMEQDAIAFINENRGLNDLMGQYERLNKKYQDMKLAQAQGKDYYTTKEIDPASVGSGTVRFKETKHKFDSDDLRKANQELLDLSLSAGNLGVQLEVLKTLNSDFVKSAEFQALEEEFNGYTLKVEEAKEVTNSLDNQTLSNLQNEAEVTAQKFEDLSDAISGSNDKIAMLEEAIAQYSELGGLTEELQEKIFNSGDVDMIAMLANKNTFLAVANGLLDEEIAKRDIAKQQILESALAEQYKLDATEDRINGEIDMENQALNSKAQAYYRDSQNFRDYIEGKVQMDGALADSLANFLASLIGGNVDAYRKDLQNCKSWAETKALIMQKLDNQMAKVTKNISDASFKLDTMYKNHPDRTFRKDIANKQLDYYTNELKKLEYEKSRIDTDFSGFGGNFNTNVPTVNRVPSVNKPNKGGSSGGKGSTKQESEYKAKLEQWYKITEAIERNSEALEENQKKLDVAQGKAINDLEEERIRLLKQQINLNTQLRNEQTKTLNGYKSELQKLGAVFDGNTISNYESLLGGTRKGEEGEKLKYLEELVNKFEKLKDTLGDTNGELQDLNKEYLDLVKDRAEFVADQEKQLYDIAKYYAEKTTEAKKSAIDEQIDALNKLKEEEEQEDDIKTRQKKLLEIQTEMDKLALATDKKGQAKFKELQQQYQEEVEALNDLIRENQHNAMVDKMEEEKEQLDKDLENYLDPANINKIIADAMKTGLMNVMGETYNVQDAMSNMLKETEIGLMNTTLRWKEMADEITRVRDLYTEIGSINSTLGLNGIYNNVSANTPKTNSNVSMTSNVNLTVNGSASQQDKDAIEKAIRKIVKEENQKILEKLNK